MSDQDPQGAEPGVVTGDETAKGTVARPGRGGRKTGTRKRPPFRRLPSDKRRQEIISTAIKVFRERPQDEVSIDDLAAAAGSSRSSLYRYFDSKQELYEAVAGAVGAEVIERLSDVDEGVPSWNLMIRLTVYFDFIEEYEGIVAGVLAVGSSEAPEAARAAAQRVRDHILRITCDTLEVGEPTPALEMVIRSWIAGVEWAGVEWLRTRSLPRGELEILLARQLGITLIGVAPSDPAIAERVAWWASVEPPDGPFGVLLRSVTGLFDVKMMGHLARMLSYEEPAAP
ncbi:TetR/AcrR family transcriptional regulator [Spirillospora sp. NPDC047279]|uniref:TetR/AcrR family transcriptional regulator n=1 Tax=Spirillospora sp. NPDC047279 TaxID=3155478 RepID=UPI0033E423BA